MVDVRVTVVGSLIGPPASPALQPDVPHSKVPNDAMGYSSVGRASDSNSDRRGFDSLYLHHGKGLCALRFESAMTLGRAPAGSEGLSFGCRPAAPVRPVLEGMGNASETPIARSARRKYGGRRRRPGYRPPFSVLRARHAGVGPSLSEAHRALPGVFRKGISNQQQGDNDVRLQENFGGAARAISAVP